MKQVTGKRLRRATRPVRKATHGLERTQAEIALRESEERYRVLTELSSDWPWEQDAELKFVSVSDTVLSHSWPYLG